MSAEYTVEDLNIQLEKDLLLYGNSFFQMYIVDGKVELKRLSPFNVKGFEELIQEKQDEV